MLWSDGRLVEGGTLPFAMGDRGLLLGDGVFDTALALQGRVAFEAAHVDRLAAAAAALGFPVDRARIVEAMQALAGAVPLASGAGCAIDPSVDGAGASAPGWPSVASATGSS